MVSFLGIIPARAGEEAQGRPHPAGRTVGRSSSTAGGEEAAPGDPAQRGRTLFLQGRYQEAYSVLGQVLQSQPDHLGARLDHARTCLTLGYLGWDRALIDKAERDLQDVLVAQPQNPAARELSLLIDSLKKRMSTSSPVAPAPLLREPGKAGPRSAGKLSSRQGSLTEIPIDGPSPMVHPTQHGPNLTKSDSDRAGTDLPVGVR